MRQTFTTTMPDRVGAFLKASRSIAGAGANITRVSYNKAVDMHILFIEVEGTKDQLFRVERELGAEGLQRLRMSELTQDEHHYIRQLFRTAIQPLLSPQIVDAHHPFPHLASKTLHVGVRLSRKKSEFWGLIPMPPSVPELLFLPEQNGICRYVPLEEVLLFYADSVFEMYSTLEKVVFCVTRNADINPDDEPFAPEGREIELRAKMEKLLDNPKLLQTPIVRNGKQATVGFCPDVWKTWE